MLLSLRYLVGTVVVLTGLMMAAKRYVDINICVPIARRGGASTKVKKKKKKGSLGDSLSVLKSSPMILNLALLVVSYGVSHRLFEFAWKGQLRALYPSAQAYQVPTSAWDACAKAHVNLHSMIKWKVPPCFPRNLLNSCAEPRPFFGG
jgi:ATP/ADP translocase